MTRINTIEPADLLDQHLMAEYRELPRAVKGARKLSHRERLEINSFRLGAGHVKWFFPLGGWLVKRHALIKAELQARGYNLAPQPTLIPKEGCSGTWSPSPWDHRLLLSRLQSKLDAKPSFYRLRGKPVPQDYYDQLRAKYGCSEV
jgi:deoxyribonuclease (pyrimidine dimer)